MNLAQAQNLKSPVFQNSNPSVYYFSNDSGATWYSTLDDSAPHSFSADQQSASDWDSELNLVLRREDIRTLDLFNSMIAEIRHQGGPSIARVAGGSPFVKIISEAAFRNQIAPKLSDIEANFAGRGEVFPTNGDPQNWISLFS